MNYDTSRSAQASRQTRASRGTIFLASNPVGWAIAGGATIYFGVRFVYDISTKP